jgi:drug/metabolite transporter (DMT)-like permease
MSASRSFGWPDVGVLSAAVLWGLNYTSVKVALGDLPPLVFGSLRFLIATSLLFGLLALVEHGVRVTRADTGRLLLMGSLSIGINQVLFLDGLRRTSASIGAIMFACASAFTIMLAVYLLGERAGPRLWAGVVLASGGIAVIVGQAAAGGGGALFGDVEIFVSALAVGLSSLIAKSVLQRYSALRVTAWSSLWGLCCLLPFGAIALPTVRWSHVQPHAWDALAFTAIGASVVTLILWYAGIARIGVVRATAYGYLQPILGVVFAAVLLGDQLSARQLVGGAVALVGTWLASSSTISRSPRPIATDVSGIGGSRHTHIHSRAGPTTSVASPEEP